MKSQFAALIFISIIAAQVLPLQSGPQAAMLPAPDTNISGRWQVKFNLSGVGEKNLVFEAQAEGIGSFLLLDTAADGKQVADPQPAVWSQTTKNRVSLSGEVELPMGTCCREIGTLMLKGKFSSNNTISGKAIFVSGTTDEENYTGFRSTLGTFTATRINHKD